MKNVKLQKENTVLSGGACFTPRLDPRPPYPHWWGVLRRAALRHVRVSLVLAALTKLLHPVFLRVLRWCRARSIPDRVFFALGTSILHSGLYFTINSFFLYCDKSGHLSEYKMDRKPAVVPSDAQIWNTIKSQLVAKLVAGPFVNSAAFSLFEAFGMPDFAAPLPSFLSLCGMYMGCIAFNDWGFYWSHRAVHSKFLYKTIHKQHHSYIGTIGFAAEEAHPVEQIVSNIGPTIGGCLFFGRPLLVFWLWLGCRLQQTYEGHSGYSFADTWLHRLGFTNADAAAYHDFHHVMNRGNFGAEYLDWTFGTMDAYLALGGTEGYRKLGKDVHD